MSNLLIFKQATSLEKSHISNDKDFSLSYILPKGSLVDDWPCFYLKIDCDIISYLSTEIHFIENGSTTEEIWIQNLCTKDFYQRKSYGKELVKNFFIFCKNNDYKKISLFAHKEYTFNFWEKLGFTKISKEGESTLFTKSL